MNRLTFISGLVMAAVLTACQPSEKKIRIGYVQITQDAVLDKAKAGVFKALTDSGFIDGQNIKVLDNNAQGDLSMINMIMQSLISQNVDFIITCGTPCMVAAAATVRDIPVVFTVATGPEQLGFKSIPENLHGLYDPLQTDEFVNLLVECIPGISRVGVPYNNAEPNAEYAVGRLSQVLEARGITPVTASVTSANEILQAGQYLAGQQIDALVATADNTVYMGLPILAKTASAQKIPLFVTDPLQVEKGAAIGLGVSYEQWGYQSGLKAVDILKGRNLSGKRIEPLTGVHELSINRKACADQGLQVPESVTARAARIIN